jgi:hypothetical protein
VKLRRAENNVGQSADENRTPTYQLTAFPATVAESVVADVEPMTEAEEPSTLAHTSYAAALETAVQLKVTGEVRLLAPSPGRTNPGSVVEQSAAVTLVVTLATLLLVFGSGDAEEMLAAVLSAPTRDGAVSVMVTGCMAPAGAVAILHVAAVTPVVQVQPPPDAAVIVAPSCVVTVSETSVAAFGPLFVELTV